MNWFLKLFKKNNKIDTILVDSYEKNKVIYKHYYFVNYNKLNKFYKLSKETEVSLEYVFNYPKESWCHHWLDNENLTEQEISSFVNFLFRTVKQTISPLQYC